MSFDWPVLRPMRFLAKSRGNTHTTNASSYISSRGFTLQTATAGNRLPRSHYGPGTVFQGELNLHLLKAIPSPCQLRIVLTCHQTITPMAQDGPNASSVASSKPTTLFTVEHILVNNEALAAKRHFFHFSIKFPMCNYAPSYKDENGRSVVYSAKAFLTFETQPTNPASKAELSSPELELKYLPVVPASIPRNEVVENAQLVDPTTNQTCIRATVDSSQRGMSPGWLLVSFFTMFVGLSLAEICSAFPTTGGLYFWTIRLASAEWVPLASWIVGYTNWLGLCVAIASTDLAMAQFLASLVTMLSGYEPSTYVIFAIYVGIIILHGMVNSMTVRLNGFFNILSVWWHVVGTLMIVIVVLAYTPEKQSASFVFTAWVNNTGWNSSFYVFMLGLLQSQYTLSGYDSAAHMAEETKNAQHGGPMGIIRAILGASIIGWFFLIGITFCITDFQAQIVSPTVGVALSQIFLDAAGQTWAIILILVILGAQFFCGSALTLASSRMVYAFARDGALPLSKHLHRLNKDKSPVSAVWFNIAFCFILGLPYIWSETAFSAIVSVNTIASSISYLIPILCRIILARHTFQPGPFSLGKFSTPVGIVSSIWITVTSVLFLCPTTAPVTVANMNYALVPFVLVIGMCSLYYALWGRHWFTPGGTRIVADSVDEEQVGETEDNGVEARRPANEKEEVDFAT